MNLSYEYNGYKIDIKETENSKYRVDIKHPYCQKVDTFTDLNNKRDCIGLVFEKIKENRYV